MDGVPVTSVVEAFEYTGTNGTDIRDQLNDYSAPGVTWSVLSETGGTLQLRRASGFNDDYEVHASDTIVITGQNETTAEFLTVTGYAKNYTPTVDVLAEVAPPVSALGVASVPSLAGNTQTTVAVTIQPTLSGVGYTAAAALTGSVSLLSSLSILSVTNASAAQVDVVVRNTGLLTLAGASVIVIALE